MDWFMLLITFFVILVVFLLIGFPVAFAFLITNIITVIMIMGFDSGMNNLLYSAFESISKFSLTPIPLYIMMGALLFHSEIARKVLDVSSKLLTKIPARLSIITTIIGLLFSALSGSAVANASMLGSTMVPDMQRRGYHLKMIIGPILGAGTLAVIIPPSVLVILLGSLGRISIGDLLIAGILPGLLIGGMLILYYIVLGIKDPSLAPTDPVADAEDGDDRKGVWLEFFKYVIPLSLLIIVVLGAIFTGLATPTESAAIGTVGAMVLMMIYKKFTVNALREGIKDTIVTSGMILLILSMSAAFSQLLAYSGTTRELVSLAVSSDLAPMITVIIMIAVVLLLGTFIEPFSIIMITVPLYMPVIDAFGYDPLWFGILLLIAVGVGNITPPFGLLLFVIKGSVSRDISMAEIYKSVIGVIVIFVIGIAIMFIFPGIITWLPSLGV